MKYDFAQKLAKVITEYSVEVKAGDFVVIAGSVAARPLIEALYEQVLRRGGNPVVDVALPGLSEMHMELGNEQQLGFLNPIQKLVVEEADVFLSISAPINTKALATVDPAKIARAQQAAAPLFRTHLQRHADGSLRWCILPWPTEAAAQQAEMGIHAYSDFVYRACGLHHEDPVAYWQEVSEQQTRWVNYLKDKTHFEVKGPDIDLSFDFPGRTWISAHGKLNFPDGEIFTGPVEDSVNGTVRFNLPTIFGGREVDGVRLTFRDGVVVEATADKNEDYLLTQLDLDEGARRLGEFAIGTNWGVDRVTGSTLFDEKIGGTIHMALGASLPGTGGVNESQVHWDMVHSLKDDGEIYVDGELINRCGEFLI